MILKYGFLYPLPVTVALVIVVPFSLGEEPIESLLGTL
jgi:hypothetical protein